MRASYLRVFWRATLGVLPVVLLGMYVILTSVGLPWWGATVAVWMWGLLTAVTFGAICAHPFRETAQGRGSRHRRAVMTAERPSSLRPLPPSLHDLPPRGVLIRRRRR